MEAETSGDPGRAAGRRGITLADLMALTLGVAVATALEWYSGSAASARIAGRPAPGWYVAGNRGIEVCQKGCIALGVLILFRKWRSGGGLRPAEALPMFVALPPVAFSLSKWPGFGIYHQREPATPWNVSVDLDALNLWMMAQVALGLMALVLVLFRRGRLPGWAAGALIVVSYDRLAEPLGYFFQERANRRFESVDFSPIALMLAYSALVQFPLAMLHELPLAAAVVDFGRRDRPRRSWSEWSGILLGATVYLLVLARYLAQHALSVSTLGAPSRKIATDVIAFGVGALLARWFGPRVRRLSGPVEDDPG